MRRLGVRAIGRRFGASRSMESGRDVEQAEWLE
jgi:hypothetical protein